MHKEANTKRIAKNTAFLYVRMVVSLMVSLYTSRLVLEVLGVSDYGVYNVVGGIVGLFTFINASMSGATSRFFNFELGKNPEGRKLQEVFNSALLIHIIVAIIIVIVAETIGLWLLNNKLVIPAQSMNSAQWVYQISVFSAMISITQVPYNAALVAEERMNIYAIIELISTFLKLAIVLLLWVLNGPKLLIYSALVAVVSISIMLTYRIYCLRHFVYCKINFSMVERTFMKPMLTFSGWDTYGNMSTMARTQGISMLANMFFGTAVNAAMGIAGQIQAALNSFATNITFAIKPQIIKSYSAGDYAYTKQLLYKGAKYSYLIILLMALPVLMETPFVLSAWLKTVPEYTVWICRWTLIFIFFSNMSFVFVTGVHASGDIKRPSMINGSIYLSVVPITYIAYKLHGSVYIPFILNALSVFVGAMLNLYYTKRHIPNISIREFLYHDLGICLLVTVLSAAIPFGLHIVMPIGWIRFISVTLCCIVSVSFFSWKIALNASERTYVARMTKNSIIKLKNRS